MKQFLLILSLFFVQLSLFGQSPMNCGTPNVNFSNDCGSACYICDFTGINGNNVGFSPTGALNFCGPIENDMWMAFVAGVSNPTFTLVPSNCILGDGLELALYGSCSSPPLECVPGFLGGGLTPLVLSASGLTIGETYYLLIDGTNGDNCDFNLSVSPLGGATAPIPPAAPSISGPTTVCKDSTNTYSIAPIPGATAYTWFTQGHSVNGLSQKETIQGSAGTSASITFSGSLGGSQVCVWGVNVCEDGSSECLTVVTEACPPPSMCNPVFEYIIGDCGEVQLINQTPPPAIVIDWTVSGPSGYFNTLSGNSPITNLPESGAYTVTLNVTCDGGNTFFTQSETFTIVVDDIPPVFGNCPTQALVYQALPPDCIYDFTFPDLMPSDNSGSFSLTCSINGMTVNPNQTIPLPVGTYPAFCQATDSCGNMEGCEFVVEIECQQGMGCGLDSSCIVGSSINLGTGIDAFGNVIPSGTGQTDPYWRLLNSPPYENACNNPLLSSLNGTPYVANYFFPSTTAWVNQTGAGTLSPFDQGNGPNMFGCNNSFNSMNQRVPYVFERVFCICEEDSFNINLSFAGDDRLFLELWDLTTNTRLDFSTTYIWSSTPAPIIWNSTQYLTAGSYAIRAKLVNTNSTTLGLSVVGGITAISGNEYIVNKGNCCIANTINVLKVLDTNCNGQTDQNDQVGQGWTFELKDNTNTVISTVTTDINGEAFFANVPNGTFTVCEVPQSGWVFGTPNTGQQSITITDSSFNVLTFFNCPDPCDSMMVTIDSTCACIDSSIITGNPCTAQFDPVCGCDGNTYSNSCFATEAGVPTWVAGECSPTNPPPPTPTCDSCCYTLDLKVPSGLSRVCFDMLTPGVIFNTAALNAASLQIDTAANGRQICIQDNVAGRPRLTAGVYDNFMKLCLGNVTDPSQFPQCVEVTYLVPSPIDGFDVLCRDTLKFYCEPVEIGADSCVSVVTDSVICYPNDPTRFTLILDACNLSAFAAGNLNITSQDPTINFWPCNYPLTFPAPTSTISLPFSSPLNGGSCQQICVDVISNTPITGPYTFQIAASLWSTDTCCTAPAIFDATIEPCCDPCDGKSYVSTDVSGTGGTKTVAFTASKDGFITNTQASFADGTSAFMQVGFENVGTEIILYNAYVEFDFALCENAKVSNAELRLFANPTSIGHFDNVLSNTCWKLQRVTDPWTEATLFADNPQSTTSNEIGVNAPTSAFQDYNLNVTQLVQDMIANPTSSHGFKLTTTCNHDHTLNFATREYLTQALRPTLVITYDDTQCDSIAFGDCCHSIDLKNDCDKDFFTKVAVESATAGVIISSHYTGGSSPTDWSNPKSTATCIQWAHTSGFIPQGTSPAVLNFCLGDIDPGESPQVVYLKWYTTAQNGMDSVACVDTLTYDCQPPVENDCITVMDIQAKGNLCDSIDCYNEPFCLPWLRDMITNSLAGGCPNIAVFSSFEVAYYNGSPVIIGHKTGGMPHGNSDWIFSCNGDTIQYCYDWLGGYDCDPDAGIDLGTDLTGLTTIWTCPQALPALPTTCGSGSTSTPSMTYCMTIKNSSSPPHFATDLLLGSATSGVSIFPNSIPLPSPGLPYCGVTTVTFTVYGTIAPGDSVKIFARLHDSFTGDDWCCFDADTICLPVPPCPPPPADSCCTDFDEFCDLIDLGWQVTYLDSCTVEVTANQFDSCHWFSTLAPDWGDGSINLPAVTAANGTFTHTYATAGTYPICINVFEGDSLGGVCWEKFMCDTVTVDCDTMPVDACCAISDSAFCAIFETGFPAVITDCSVCLPFQLDSCDVLTVDFGDGSGTQTFTVGATVCHTYPQPGGGFVITANLQRFDAMGNICHEKDTIIDLFTNCPIGTNCCTISDSAFCDILNIGINPAVDMCTVCLPFQLDSCDQLSIDWGDSRTNVYGIGQTICHTYPPSLGSWTVTATLRRFDAMGMLCKEKDSTFTVQTNCMPTSESCPTCANGMPSGPNLVQNGDFSLGNTGFTSTYTYQTSGLMGSGDYSIRTATTMTNGQWSNVGHTTATATDPFLVLDGPFATAAYSTTVNVVAGKMYQLCFYANNIVKTSTASQPSLEVQINGAIAIPSTPLPKIPDNWVLFTASYTATTTGSITIDVFDRDPNDFNDWAMDDVSFVQCGMDTPVDSCCIVSDSVFCAILDATVQYTLDSCEICFPNTLDSCDNLTIDFGDGTTNTYTSISPSICHQYAVPGGNFTVTTTLTRFDAMGVICKQKDSTFTITTDCPPEVDSCCANPAAFHALVNQGWTVTYGDSCTVTVSANQFGNCHWFGSLVPDWGDGSIPPLNYVPANGTFTHTYATPGTYSVCMIVHLGPSTDSLCSATPMCVPVTVDCCDGICDSLNITASSDPLSGDTCCYIVSIENNYCQADYFKGISVQTQAPTTISHLSGLNGWIINQFSPTTAEIYPPSGGFVPNGAFDIFKICTDNYVTVPHFVDVSWLVPNGAGGCDTICPKALEFDCAIPPTLVSCVEITEDSIDCETGMYCFKIKNNSTPGFDINQVDLINLSPSGVVLTPNPIAIPLLTNGQTSGWICTAYAGVNPNDTLCYNLTAHFVNTQGQLLTCCTDTVTHCVEIPDCPGCCADFDAFCDLVDLGWTVTYGDSCEVTVTANQFDSCHWFGSVGPDWGDGTATLPSIVAANGTFTHRYTTPGTYPICITVYEGDSSSNFCWDKMMCDTVTVDCCQGNICDSLSITQRPDIVNGDTCCHIVEMTNNWCGTDTLLGFKLRTQNPAIFNQLNTLPGWNITQFTTTMAEVRRLGGTPIPQGAMDVFQVCTDNYNTLPHEIEVSWLLKTGNLAAEICPDTLEFSCDTMPPSRPCVLIVKDSFDCATNSYCFQVQNNSTPGFTINELQFVNLSPAGATLSPNPIPVPPLAAGQTSGWVCTTFSGLNEGDTLCVNVVGHFADTLGNYLTCCTDTVTHCTVLTGCDAVCCNLTQVQYDSLLDNIIYIGQDSTTCEVCLDYDVDSCDVLTIDFGDGSMPQTFTGMANTLCHNYDSGGVYSVSVDLVRYDANGDTCLATSKTITVGMFCIPPPIVNCCGITQSSFDSLFQAVINFSMDSCEICWSPLDPCSQLTVDYGDGTILTYQSGDTLCYDYPSSGVYSVTATLERFDSVGDVCRTADSTFMVTAICDIINPCDINAIVIYNALSPDDGNNLNNQLIIEKPPVCGAMNIKIFNRWGQLVWQQADYDNTWSGRSIQEENLPDGTYYLIVEFPDAAAEKPVRMQRFIDLRRD